MPAGCDINALHVQLENTARNLTERHFLAILAFSGFDYSVHNGFADGWTDEEMCKWAYIQDERHANWMTNHINGDWGLSRAGERDHQNSHICPNLPPDFGLKIRLYCGQYIDKCAPVTCREFLASVNLPTRRRAGIPSVDCHGNDDSGDRRAVRQVIALVSMRKVAALFDALEKAKVKGIGLRTVFNRQDNPNPGTCRRRRRRRR
jgi:hypothetical protein